MDFGFPQYCDFAGPDGAPGGVFSHSLQDQDDARAKQWDLESGTMLQLLCDHNFLRIFTEVI